MLHNNYNNQIFQFLLNMRCKTQVKLETEKMKVPKSSDTIDPWTKTVSILLRSKENRKQNHFKLKNSYIENVYAMLIYQASFL